MKEKEKENGKEKYKKKLNKIFNELEEEEKEIIDLFPKGYMVYTQRSTGEEFVSKEYHELIEKLLHKKITLYLKKIKDVIKVFKKVLK